MLGTMDIKDAFLQVPQEEPLRLRMPGGDFIVLKNLPGQRIGAKAWLTTLARSWLEELGFEACRLNPCLLRSKKAVLLVHVDDVMVHLRASTSWKSLSRKDIVLEENISKAGRWHSDHTRALHREHAGGL